MWICTVKYLKLSKRNLWCLSTTCIISNTFFFSVQRLVDLSSCVCGCLGWLKAFTLSAVGCRRLCSLGSDRVTLALSASRRAARAAVKSLHALLRGSRTPRYDSAVVCLAGGRRTRLLCNRKVLIWSRGRMFLLCCSAVISCRSSNLLVLLSLPSAWPLPPTGFHFPARC